MKQRLLSCIAILCLLMTLPAISGAKDMGAFSELRMVVNEAQQKNLNRMRAQAEYDAIHNTNRQKYIARSWTSSNGDVYTMQLNKFAQPLCEMVSYDDGYGNPIHPTFDELPLYCVIYVLLKTDTNGEIVTNLSMQLCWPSYYVWNQGFQSDYDIPISERNYECVTPDDLMNSTKWCNKFVEGALIGHYTSDYNNWEYFGMIPGNQGMVNGELGYTVISETGSSWIKFNGYDPETNVVSCDEEIYFMSDSGKQTIIRDSPTSVARMEGFVTRTEELPSFGDIHIFNMGLGGDGVSGFNNPYPENWGPLSQLYFIAADEYSNIKIPESMQTLQPDNINISLDLTGEEFEKHSNYIKGVLYADPKYSQNPSLNPAEEVYRLITPSTGISWTITIAPEKNTFVPYGISDKNGKCEWSEQYGTFLRLHNNLTYLGQETSMAFGTKNGYRFSGTDYYGNIINAQSKGKCIYHYDPTDVHKTREFSLIGDIEDITNPVLPDDPTDNANYYIIGSDVNGHFWELAQDDCKFKAKGRGIYEWNGEYLGTGFKINDGTWGPVNFGAGEITKLIIGEPFAYINYGGSGNIDFEDGTGVINPKVVLDTKNETITVTGQKEGDSEYFFTGDFNNWAIGEGALKMTEIEDGIYSVTNVELPETGEFKIVSTGWAKQYGNNAPIGEDPIEISMDVLSTVLGEVYGTGGACAFTLLHGYYDITWNSENANIKFELVEEILPTPTDATLTVNTINGPEIETVVPINTYITTRLRLDEYWTISKATLNGLPLYLTNVDKPISILMDADKTLEVELAYNGTLEWIKGETGVAYFEGTELTIAVNADGSLTVSGLNTGDEIIIYNLAGQIVERHFARASQETCHPEPGIYIVRVNDCAAKLTVR